MYLTLGYIPGLILALWRSSRVPNRAFETPAQCTRECVKQGSDFALVSGGKVYTLKGDKSQFDKLAGQNVTIKGKVDGTTITVDSIAAAKS